MCGGKKLGLTNPWQIVFETGFPDDWFKIVFLFLRSGKNCSKMVFDDAVLTVRNK